MADYVDHGPAVPDKRDIIRRAMHASVVIGNHVYIDGGKVSQYEYRGHRGFPKEYAMNNTLSIPLDTSWTAWKVEIRVLDPAPGPMLEETTFWFDDSINTAYRFGGKLPGNEDKDEKFHIVYELEADGNGGGIWTEARQPAWLQTRTKGFSANSKSTGFYYGGLSNAREQPSIIEYDFKSGEWSKQYHQAAHRFGMYAGDSVYLPLYGPGGLLFLFGGVNERHLDKNRLIVTSLESLHTIKIYDPDSKSWHSQKTSGDVPSQRYGFCTVGVQSTYTYEIFIYGGSQEPPAGVSNGGSSTTTFYDVFVLSIPGFHWFSVSTHRSIPRIYHTCELVGRRQMLVIGGLDKWGANSYAYDTHDPLPQGLGVYDLVELRWKAGYDANAPAYKPPRKIQDWYDRESMDSINWSSPVVRNLFQAGVAKADPFGQPRVNSPTPSSSSAAKPVNDSPSTSAIVGAIIGGLASIAILAFLVFWIFRRRKQALEARTKDQEGWGKPELATAEQQRHELHNGSFPGAELDRGDVLELEPEGMLEVGTGQPHELGLAVQQVVFELDPTPRDEVVTEMEEKTTVGEAMELE